jgi:hypothetical protein
MGQQAGSDFYVLTILLRAWFAVKSCLTGI